MRRLPGIGLGERLGDEGRPTPVAQRHEGFAAERQHLQPRLIHGRKLVEADECGVRIAARDQRHDFFQCVPVFTAGVAVGYHGDIIPTHRGVAIRDERGVG